MKKTFWLLALLLLMGCSSSKWSDDENWFNTDTPVNESLVDVFYLVSTNVIEEHDEQGNACYLSRNTEEEKQILAAEMNYARQMFGDSVNFFSPYYSQFTLNALQLTAEQQNEVRAQASKDAVDAFRYYMKHLNQGRSFILAGFSQGAMHLIDVLKEMTPSEYRSMIVAYSLGYRLSAKDLEHPHVNAAQTDTDRGVTVSFNSVARTDAMWPVVNEGAATCINPINYTTNATPATFVFNEDTLTVQVDTTHHVLLVNSKKIDEYRFPVLEGYCKPGNLHHWDLLFYKEAIRQNALKRAYKISKCS